MAHSPVDREKTAQRNVIAFFIFRLFLWSVALNYPWEMLQMPLYEAMPFTDPMSWILCFRATIGDGFIILMLWGIGFLLTRRINWFGRRRKLAMSLLVISGAAVAIGIELHALRTGRWMYSDLMPVVPLIGTGLSPLVQLILLPLAAMRLASWKIKGKSRNSPAEMASEN